MGGPSTTSQFALAISKWWLSTFIRVGRTADEQQSGSERGFRGHMHKGDGLDTVEPTVRLEEAEVRAGTSCSTGDGGLSSGDLTPSEASHSIRLPSCACGTVHTSEPVWARGSHFVAPASSSF